MLRKQQLNYQRRRNDGRGSERKAYIHGSDYANSSMAEHDLMPHRCASRRCRLLRLFFVLIWVVWSLQLRENSEATLSRGHRRFAACCIDKHRVLRFGECTCICVGCFCFSGNSNNDEVCSELQAITQKQTTHNDTHEVLTLQAWTIDPTEGLVPGRF